MKPLFLYDGAAYLSLRIDVPAPPLSVGASGNQPLDPTAMEGVRAGSGQGGAVGARGRRWSRTGEPLLSELAGRGHLRNRGPDHAGLLPALDSRTPLETLLLRLETLWSLQCWPHKGLGWFFRWRGGPCSCLSKRHYSSDILILPLDILLPQHRAVSVRPCRWLAAGPCSGAGSGWTRGP